MAVTAEPTRESSYKSVNVSDSQVFRAKSLRHPKPRSCNTGCCRAWEVLALAHGLAAQGSQESWGSRKPPPATAASFACCHHSLWSNTEENKSSQNTVLCAPQDVGLSSAKGLQPLYGTNFPYLCNWLRDKQVTQTRPMRSLSGMFSCSLMNEASSAELVGHEPEAAGSQLDRQSKNKEPAPE